MYEGLTRRGAEYLAKCQANALPITFTKVKIGNGFLTDEDDPMELQDIKSIKKEVDIANKVQNGESLEITVQIDNQDLEEGYYPREIGVYVVDNEQEILYWYINDGNECSWLPPASKAPIKYKTKLNLIATSLDVVIVNWTGSGLWIDAEILEKELKTKLNKGNVPSEYDTAEKIVAELKKVETAVESIEIDWDEILHKPNSFPPSNHTHPYLSTSGGTISGALTVTGNTNINGDLIGTFTKTISGFGKVYNAIWNDYAEFFEKGEETETGDIIALDLLSKEEQYIKASNENTCVVGVHSNEFAILIGGEEVPKGIDYYKHNIKKFIPVGLMGRVKCKVIGKIKKGEEIGASHIAGVGIKGQGVGIALENKENEEIGLVRILLKGKR